MDIVLLDSHGEKISSNLTPEQAELLNIGKRCEVKFVAYVDDTRRNIVVLFNPFYQHASMVGKRRAKDFLGAGTIENVNRAYQKTMDAYHAARYGSLSCAREFGRSAPKDPAMAQELAESIGRKVRPLIAAAAKIFKKILRGKGTR